MRIPYELCLATAGKQVPLGPDWIHEVKHDGYRMLVIRENDRVRLHSRGSEWTKRYPWIAAAALKNWRKHFRFQRAELSGSTTTKCFYAFDILAMGGDDLRALTAAAGRSSGSR
ncbi:hypothetical protein [Bradyrhizobium liaoningense]|uniref:hypothetical protein n=1 Tax=Bradyrhizobium liaoningense TaxID=43992 RepID=UPI00201184B2|nr:hypothetical protein [Bradyrhizobium liaoningense]